MDHAFRGHRRGLIEIGTVTERRSRDEFQMLVDPYAESVISALAPAPYQQQLRGWARSYYSLEAHVKAILAYDTPKLPEPTDAAWNQTKQHLVAEFRQMDRVIPISHKSFDSVKWIRSSAAGYGYKGAKGDFDNYLKARTTAYTIAKRLDVDRDYGPQAIKDSTPDIAFTRTQLSQVKVKSKVRNVWGEAFHYVLLEGLFADRFIEYFSSIESFYFIGRDPLLAVPALIEEILSECDYVYMFDWSAFDSSVQEWEIRFAFLLLESLLTFPSNVEAQVWRFIIELFIYRKIAGPDQVLYLKTQGIPSGSCFTNIIGSITNYVRIQYMFKKLTNEFATVFTHGDDSLAGVKTDQYTTFDKLAAVSEPLGWHISTLKSEVSMTAEATSFLSRTVREKQNARDALVCLRMLMFPEYEVKDGSISALRAKSIAIDAGINSPLLYDIYVYLSRKYGVATSLPDHLKVWDPIEYETRRQPYFV